VFYSDETHVISVDSIEGKCEVRKKSDIPEQSVPGMFQNVFFCELLYDPATGSLKKVLCIGSIIPACNMLVNLDDKSANMLVYYDTDSTLY